MESEKVKEIKKALETYGNENKGITLLRGGEIRAIPYTDILTLINELESENERFIQSCKNCHYIKDLELANRHTSELKDRIAELEKENDQQYKRIMELEQDLVHADENVFYRECNVALNEKEIKEQALKQFAERLKEQVYDSFGDKVIWYNDIDETLKEFIGDSK